MVSPSSDFSSDSFFRLAFISCANFFYFFFFFFKKQLYCPFLCTGFIKRLQSHYEQTLSFLPLSYHQFWVSKKSCRQLFFNSHVLMVNSEKYTLSFPKKLPPTIFQFARIDGKFWKIYLSRLYVEHKWFEEGMGVCSSINLSFRTWYDLITFDKMRQ